MLIVLRSPSAPAQLDAVRATIRALDDEVAVFEAATVDASILSWLRPVRAATALLTALGGIALAIAVLGIYGVVSYFVSTRTREFGIRMALGATPPGVMKLVIDDAVHLLLVGLLVGVWVAVMGERLLQYWRFQFLPNEVMTWIVVLTAIMAVGLLAAYVPARRAARIDPNVALREL
jgi:ABC-type antimicrobial peptide transport system permease subunit